LNLPQIDVHALQKATGKQMQDEKNPFHHIQVFIQAIRIRKQKVNK
jgi:hypothetical protein